MSLLLPALLLTHATSATVAETPGQAQVNYVLRHEPAPRDDPEADAWWVVEVNVKNLPREGEVGFTLSDWGGWPEDERGYVEVLHAAPPLRNSATESGRFEPELEGRRPTKLEFVYRVRLTRMGSEAQQRFGLSPTWSEDYAWGYSWNTLVQVELDGKPLPGKRWIELVAAGSEPITTGWMGSTRSPQRTNLDPSMGNAPIAFGRLQRSRIEDRDGSQVEIYQFGRGPDVTPTLAEVLHACAPAFGEALGVPAKNPYRAFVTDNVGGGMGSHFGLRIGVQEGDHEDHEHSPWLRHHVAHELLHDWLGNELTERSSQLVWFKEGFTEYLSLWQVTAAGLVDRDYFANRLLELESIASDRSSSGEVAFGDPDVQWRDGDGPNELLAYTGAPLLALRLDAELRAGGRPGLMQLLRDLLAEEDRSYDLEELRRWMAANGLEERYRLSILGKELPDVAGSLELAGYGTTKTPCDLTYFGLATDFETPGCKVLAIDPDGPAAKVGIQVGDVLTGWYPVRAARAEVGDFETEYAFGLGSFQPGVEGTFLGVKRGGVDSKTFLEPVVLGGKGLRTTRSSEGEALDAFFSFEPE